MKEFKYEYEVLEYLGFLQNEAMMLELEGFSDEAFSLRQVITRLGNEYMEGTFKKKVT